MAKLRRVDCPYCGRKAVALTSRTGHLYPHTIPGTLPITSCALKAEPTAADSPLVSLDERLTQLNSRMLGWLVEQIKVQGDLSDVFADAAAHYQRAARKILIQVVEDWQHAGQIVRESPNDMLLNAFDDALTAMDMLQQFAEGEMEGD